MQRRIPYAKPCITDLEIRYATDTAANGWGERCHDDITRFEDAAEAIGSVSHGRRAGSIGRFGAFSFHGTKTLTTGEGSMFVTNDADLYERVLTVRRLTENLAPDCAGFSFAFKERRQEHSRAL
jgi:dTDP-4-amino-4,6-dideoxygalactose transaminase